MADDGQVIRWGELEKDAGVWTVTGSALPNGVSWGSTPAVLFGVVVFDDQGVQPTLTLENGVCVDDIASPVVPPTKTEKAADDGKPPVKPSDADGEAR